MTSGGLKFPLATWFLPFPLIQFIGKKVFLVKFKASGFGQIASIEEMTVNGKFFPDVTKQKPLLAVKISNLKLRFDVAKIIEPNGE